MNIDPNEVLRRYNKTEVIWMEKDKWHMWTYKMIYRFIHSSCSRLGGIKDLKILNAGSGGNNYGLPEKNILHVDLATKHLDGLSNSLIANIENIPLEGQSFDLIICVGSVINYCDPVRVINEFSRLLKAQGYLILEFENSKTLELIGKKSYNNNAVIIETFYNDTKEKIWYFSEGYILRIAIEYGFIRINRDWCHLISPLFYRLSKSENFAAWFAKFDTFFKRVTFLKNVSSNMILLLHKTQATL